MIPLNFHDYCLFCIFSSILCCSAITCLFFLSLLHLFPFLLGRTLFRIFIFYLLAFKGTVLEELDARWQQPTSDLKKLVLKIFFRSPPQTGNAKMCASQFTSEFSSTMTGFLWERDVNLVVKRKTSNMDQKNV
ncbi:hypothetical protein ACS0TY_018000 [Phlomoides rotata]